MPLLFALLSLCLAVIHVAVAADCNAAGERVTVEGFVMDNLCITRGTLLDMPNVKTLQNPELHTIYCLAGVQSCVDSGYVILAPPSTTGGDYTVLYALGPDGTKLARTAAQGIRQRGATKGFRMKVQGVVANGSELKCVEAISSSATDATGASVTAQTA